MGIVTILAAAAASWLLGALWYAVLATPWMAAAGILADNQGRPENFAQPHPYIVSLVAAALVAAMMRYMFNLAGIEQIEDGLMAGLGLGLFVAVPWIATNYAFANRSILLTLIDGGYAASGCAIMGLVLTLV